MANSSRFRQMRSRLAELRAALLPSRFSPSGIYNDRIRIRACSYRVLSHAEMESYVEDVSWKLARDSVIGWQEKRIVSAPIIGLTSFFENDLGEPPPALDPPQASNKLWKARLEIEERINRALNNYHYAVKNNHGIKESNLLTLLLPLGIERKDIDEVWLAEMESFGSKRGEVAHSSQYSIKTKIDPKEEKDIVSRLVVGWKQLDERFFS